MLRSDQLKLVQNGGKAVHGLALSLAIIVPLLYALAIVLAPGRRRRTLMNVGFGIAFAGLIGVAGRSILRSAVTSSLVHDASLRPAVRAVITIATGLLDEIAGAFILVGAVVIVAVWFAGPARIAVFARRALAPYLRQDSLAPFAFTAAVMVLIFIWQPIPATGTPAGIIVFMALALLGTEVLRRQTAEEFPDARARDTTAAIRARIGAPPSGRGRDRSDGGDSAAPAEQLEHLERLAALRDAGEITSEDDGAAKERLPGA